MFVGEGLEHLHCAFFAQFEQAFVQLLGVNGIAQARSAEELKHRAQRFEALLAKPRHDSV